jgi:hypothetical protein
VGECLVELGVLEKSLGGDASPVQAGAASAIRLNTSYLFPELGRADCSDISSRATTNDNEIV